MSSVRPARQFREFLASTQGIHNGYMSIMCIQCVPPIRVKTVIVKFRTKSSKRKGSYIELNLDGTLQHVRFTKGLDGVLRCDQLLTIRRRHCDNQPYISLEKTGKIIHADSPKQLVHRLISVLLYTMARQTRLPNTVVKAFEDYYEYGVWRVEIFRDVPKPSWVTDRLYTISLYHHATSNGNTVCYAYSFNDDFRDQLNKTSPIRCYGVDTRCNSLMDLYATLESIKGDYNHANV